ncbi:Tripartite tricarboxylate transporter family receptor [Pigmentiphaga humi]|uniref:Tripartite tricarboxylate transporter family receptor n=1 Tax=Pigmentiphaga humi TaxID=2478468 RepID=A0A3P4B6P0_9BURK|nr:tripartite tricarboxylate transporter substrate binding protein [Pigmentiphaga humi]VCU71328.1 Tripartite tricarboxylate transporter family receptor [Pigmentiphaga humi]
MKKTMVRLLAATAFLVSTVTHAAWPERPITLVVPWPPGGGVDASARIVAPLLSQQLGQQVIVLNKPGATGSLGAESVAKGTPDGYTLLWTALSTHVIHSVLYGKVVPYDLEKDFIPLSVFGDIPYMIVVNPKVPAHSVAELISLAKAQPGKLTFGSSGNGSVHHLASERLKKSANIELLHIPYKGIGPLLVDLVAGQIDMSIESTAASLQYIKSQKLRALAVAWPERIPSLPDVPTAAEVGLGDFRVSSTLFVAAPASTPAPVVKRLDGAIKNVFSDKGLQSKLLGLSIIAGYVSPEDSARMVHEEMTTVRTIVRDANIQVD